MKIQERDIKTIRPYDKNAKEHPIEQVQKIANSIKEFGFNQPIVVDKDGIIIVGHGRYTAAGLLGMTMVPVLVAENMSGDQVRAYRLADNKLNESSWIMDKVIEDLKQLDDNLIDLTGFDRDLLVDEDENDDVVPATPLEPKTHLGEVWLLGDHRMVIGDATDQEVIMNLMQDHKADLIFTDPPYNVDYEDGKGTKIMNDKMTDNEFDNFLALIFMNYKAIMKEGAGLYCFHSTKTQNQFKVELERAGFNVRAQLIWNKPAATLGMNDYRSKHEPFYYAGIGENKPQFYGDRTHTTIWDLQDTEEELIKWAKRQKSLERQGKTTIWTMKRDSVNSYVHPTQKPVELISYALRNSSKKGDIVVDFFGGSGSTLIACEKYGRICKTMELDPKFADVILTRFANFTGKEPIRESDGMAWSELSGFKPEMMEEDSDEYKDSIMDEE